MKYQIVKDGVIKMKELVEKIKSEGHVLNSEIIQVDSIINHQVDPAFMQTLGEDIAKHFEGQGITKIVTIESSGIAPALMAALKMNIPMIILKKEPAKVLNPNMLQTEVTSFTTGKTHELTLTEGYITENDHVLIVDDFLADGEAVTGAIRLIRKCHATVAGVSVLIEKAFQPGHEKLTEQGIEVYALASVKAIEGDQIIFNQ